MYISSTATVCRHGGVKGQMWGGDGGVHDRDVYQEGM